MKTAEDANGNFQFVIADCQLKTGSYAREN
jgi:hypothetical protein